MRNAQRVSILVLSNCHTSERRIEKILKIHNQKKSEQLTIGKITNCHRQGLNFLTKNKVDLILLETGTAIKNDSKLFFLNTLQQKKISYSTLILGSDREYSFIIPAMTAGAKGYIFKKNLERQLITAIETINNDLIYFPPEVATHFFARLNQNNFNSTNKNKLYKTNFTHREIEVLAYLTKGMSNEEIAQKLFVTIATVKAHLTSIFNKLGVKNRTQATIVAIEQNLITC